MENFVVLLIPALLAVFLIRLLLLPMKLVFKLAIHSVCGFLCLWILNTVSGFTGIYLPINAISVAIAGILGLPGIGILALLELIP
ncbi:MAG: pro-sigmaK processing inhibitor BofA family protein [Faecousia sp.]